MRTARFFTAGIAALGAFISASSAFADSDQVQLQTFGTHSRLSFEIDEGVHVQLKNSHQGFELVFPGLSLSDLGAPLGEEAQWATQFALLKDPRLGSLRFSEGEGGVKVQGEWKYPQGALALASPEMEWFGYHERAPARYRIDFWYKKGPTLIEANAKRAHEERLAAIKRADELARRRVARRLASDNRKAEIEDLPRFCRQPLSESKDVFVTLLPVHAKLNLEHWISLSNPDEGFEYFEPKKPSQVSSPKMFDDSTSPQESQYMRLALALYRHGKFALVLRTADFLDKEYPHSSYRAEMHFLRANTLIKLGIAEQADGLLRKLVAESKASPEALYAALYLAAHQLEKGQYLLALGTFMWLEDNHPEHRLAWLFHLGAAEALYALKQTERASKEYEWVAENAQEMGDKAQGAFRIGDLYLDRLQYDQALASYSQALHNFPNQAARFPSASINRAEALYGLGQYEEARAAFGDYLKRFGSSEGAWRASFRLSEIAGRSLARKDGRRDFAADDEESRKWLYETVNRYPLSPGATLGRLRLLPCGDHGGFNADAARRFYSEEAASFAGGGEVHMARYGDLEALSHVRALITFNQEEEAVQVALDEIKKNPHPDAREMLNGVLAGVFRKSILKMLADGKKYEALAFYKEKAVPLPHDPTLLEPDFLLKLSRAAADLGLGRTAEEIVSAYKKVSSGRGPADAQSEELDAQLVASEQDFTEAKALWVKSGMKAAPDVRGLLSQVKEESRFSYEREIMLGLIEDGEGHVASAVEHASKAQLLMPDSKSMARDLRLEAWLASLQARANAPQTALDLYKEVEQHLRLRPKGGAGPAVATSGRDAAEIMGIPAVPPLAQVLVEEARMQEALGKWGDAAKAYSKALEGDQDNAQYLFE